MGKSYSNKAVFASAFEVQATNPLDARFVVDSVDDLTNGTIDYPYIGLVVNIKGTDNLYILTEQDDETALPKTWKQIRGAEGINSDIADLTKQISDLTKKHVDELAQAKSDLTNYVDALEEKIYGSDALELFDTLTEIGAWIEDHQDTYEKLVEGFTGNLKTAVDNLTKLINDGDSDLQGQIDELDSKVDSAVNDIKSAASALETKLTNLINTTKSNLENAISTLEGKLEGELSDLDEKLSDEIDELELKHEADVVGLKGLIDDANTKHETELAQTVTDLTTLIAKTKSDILGADDLDAKMDSIKEVVDWINTHTTEYEALLKLAGDNKKELTDYIDGKVEELEGKISDLETKVSGDVNTAINDLQQKITAAETKHTTDHNALVQTHNDDKEELEDAIEDSMLYKSSATETWETVQVGGISAKTKPSAFEGMTISQVLDEIFYPTLNPIVPSGQPSVSISYETECFFVGTAIPAKTDFSTSTNRGNYTYVTPAGDIITGDYYAGEVATSDTTIDNGVFGGTFAEGVYNVTFTAQFAEGPSPVTNKGVAYTGVSKYAGGTKQATKTLYGVCPIYANTITIDNTDTQQPIQNYVKGGVTFTVSIPAEPQGTMDKFTLKVPSYLTVSNIQQYNPNSGKYEIDTKYMLSNKTTEQKGSVTYNVYKRATTPGDFIGAAQYQITIDKKS